MNKPCYRSWLLGSAIEINKATEEAQSPAGYEGCYFR